MKKEKKNEDIKTYEDKKETSKRPNPVTEWIKKYKRHIVNRENEVEMI